MLGGAVGSELLRVGGGLFRGRLVVIRMRSRIRGFVLPIHGFVFDRDCWRYVAVRCRCPLARHAAHRRHVAAGSRGYGDRRDVPDALPYNVEIQDRAGQRRDADQETYLNKSRRRRIARVSQTLNGVHHGATLKRPKQRHERQTCKNLERLPEAENVVHQHIKRVEDRQAEERIGHGVPNALQRTLDIVESDGADQSKRTGNYGAASHHHDDHVRTQHFAKAVYHGSPCKHLREKRCLRGLSSHLCYRLLNPAVRSPVWGTIISNQVSITPLRPSSAPVVQNRRSSSERTIGIPFLFAISRILTPHVALEGQLSTRRLPSDTPDQAPSSFCWAGVRESAYRFRECANFAPPRSSQLARVVPDSRTKPPFGEHWAYFTYNNVLNRPRFC